jgi:hypothetical protein
VAIGISPDTSRGFAGPDVMAFLIETRVQYIF